MSNWKLKPITIPDTIQNVFRVHEDGTYEVKLVTDLEFQAWLDEGNTPEPADELPTE